MNTLDKFNLFLAECEMMGQGLLINNREYLQGDKVFSLYHRYKDKIRRVIYNKNDCILLLKDNTTINLMF